MRYYVSLVPVFSEILYNSTGILLMGTEKFTFQIFKLQCGI